MVEKVHIGVVGIQGAVSEHVEAMKQALAEHHRTGQISIVRHQEDLNALDGLILPGGESTTISKLLYQSGLYDGIRQKLSKDSFSLMGTCAGCVLVAKQVLGDTKDLHVLRAMDIEVERNAFGRQRESFEHLIDIDGFDMPFNAVFIRAPVITKTWGSCKILATMDKKIVMARQDNLLALSFHPELTDDLRVHQYFLEML